MNKIALYGHGFKDTIYCGRNLIEQDRDGGIYNVARAIRLNPYESHAAIGNKAVININPITEGIDSIADWNNCKCSLVGGNVEFAHIAYANKLDNIEELVEYLSERARKISIDISEHVLPEEFLKLCKIIDKIDYFFCTWSQSWAMLNNYKCVDEIFEKQIVHHKHAISFKNYVVRPRILCNVNTLGAGDMLAGFFIDSIVCGNSEVDSLVIAEEKVHEWLKTRKLTS